jgi:hypothetical protein
VNFTSPQAEIFFLPAAGKTRGGNYHMFPPGVLEEFLLVHFNRLPAKITPTT